MRICACSRKGVTITMYSFNNDYSEGAHPKILKSLMESNLEQNTGYGSDKHCAHAAELIREQINNEEADIHFLVGGTQTNLIVISSALRPHQAVIAAVTGHINVHETGAIEATGHKVIAMECPDGKLTPDLVAKAVAAHTDEHMVQPKMVYISNSTEVGTIYTKAELEALRRICSQNRLYLYMDGARMGSALTCPANDLTLADIARLTDAFYIGGTKNGALLGEALVILNESLKPDFRYMMKQKGALAAKGWVVGTQFEELFQNDLFFSLPAHANRMAAVLKKGLEDCGFLFAFDSPTNQLFPILPNSVIAKLEKNYLFSINSVEDENHASIRLVTSWATPESAVTGFVEELKQIVNA